MLLSTGAPRDLCLDQNWFFPLFDLQPSSKGTSGELFHKNAQTDILLPNIKITPRWLHPQPLVLSISFFICQHLWTIYTTQCPKFNKDSIRGWFGVERSLLMESLTFGDWQSSQGQNNLHTDNVVDILNWDYLLGLWSFWQCGCSKLRYLLLPDWPDQIFSKA